MNHLKSTNRTLHVQKVKLHQETSGIFFPGDVVTLFCRLSVPSESDLGNQWSAQGTH